MHVIRTPLVFMFSVVSWSQEMQVSVINLSITKQLFLGFLKSENLVTITKYVFSLQLAIKVHPWALYMTALLGNGLCSLLGTVLFNGKAFVNSVVGKPSLVTRRWLKKSPLAQRIKSKPLS